MLNSIELVKDVSEFLKLKEIMHNKTEIVESHYKKLNDFWRIDISEQQTEKIRIHRIHTWIKIDLKKTIDPSGITKHPFVKVFIYGRDITIHLDGVNLARTELDSRNCSSTVRAAEYLLTHCVDEFMLKFKFRLDKKVNKLARAKIKYPNK